MLETKWSLLQQQKTSRSNMDSMFESYINNLRRQLEALGQEKLKLEAQTGSIGMTCAAQRPSEISEMNGSINCLQSET
ncbi:hypothetical protein STEG23_033463 [Scotinomys teguina]